MNYEGTRSLPGPGNRSGDQRGGFKVELLTAQEEVKGFLWMRGSKTEPAFRILADLETDRDQDEKELLDWHTELVREADRQTQR